MHRAAALDRPNVVFVLGGPGTGKGTQCARITEQFGYFHLSAGDLLRDERSNPESQHGELINNFIKEGKIVPVEITVRLLANAMKRCKWEGGNFLIDGFPRSPDNLMGFQEVLGDEVNLRSVLCFECSEAVMEARLLERGKTSGRDDDNITSIKKRFKTFQEETMPVVEYLENFGLVHRVNAEQSVEDIWVVVRRFFQTLAGVPPPAVGARSTGQHKTGQKLLHLTSFKDVVGAKRANRGAVAEDSGGVEKTLAKPPALQASASVPSVRRRKDNIIEESPWETSYRRQYQPPNLRRFYYGAAAAQVRPLTLNTAVAAAAPQKKPASEDRQKLQAELAMYSTGQLRNVLRAAGGNILSS
jgi:UMP-CMP kinase